MPTLLISIFLTPFHLTPKILFRIFKLQWSSPSILLPLFWNFFFFAFSSVSFFYVAVRQYDLWEFIRKREKVNVRRFGWHSNKPCSSSKKKKMTQWQLSIIDFFFHFRFFLLFRLETCCCCCHCYCHIIRFYCLLVAFFSGMSCVRKGTTK